MLWRVVLTAQVFHFWDSSSRCQSSRFWYVLSYCWLFQISYYICCVPRTWYNAAVNEVYIHVYVWMRVFSCMFSSFIFFCCFLSFCFIFFCIFRRFEILFFKFLFYIFHYCFFSSARSTFFFFLLLLLFYFLNFLFSFVLRFFISHFRSHPNPSFTPFPAHRRPFDNRLASSAAAKQNMTWRDSRTGHSECWLAAPRIDGFGYHVVFGTSTIL